MRFLLISDTHGKLGIINELAARTQADAVIHAGDFGFHDDGSYEWLSEREIGLHITHSGLPQDEKAHILTLPRVERIAAVKAAGLLGEFQTYIDGDKSFCVPVYAVWGNHEDRNVIERIIRGEIKLDNLHVLDGKRTFRVSSTLIYGLGGNLLPGSKMMQNPVAGGGGKIWTTLSQYVDLVRVVDAEKESLETRIFVSHVSPGKESFVELLGARTSADFTISGHMGSPTCMVWNPFAIFGVEESVARFQGGLESVKRACLNSEIPDATMIEAAFSLIGRLPEETIVKGRDARAPRWYRNMTHINLPDAHVGYAVLDIVDTRRTLQTFVV
jgi:predicted phosphodiesterase